MTKIMTPSEKEMTAGQIDKAVRNYRALLEKYSKEFDSEAVQKVLGQSEFADEQLVVFRRRVEAISNLIIRKVSVNRNRTPQEALNATGRVQYTDRNVVNNAPMTSGSDKEKDEVVFFKPDLSGRNGYISDDDLEKEYELRGLKPADLASVSAVNEADPAFADKKPHCTHWKNASGKWCFAIFDRFDGERYVRVDQYGNDWSDGWWFAGVRK